MADSNNYKLKIDFLLSNDTSLNFPTQTILQPKCNERNQISNEIHHGCKLKSLFSSSGNKVIDDLIKYTFVNNYDKRVCRLDFIPYDRFVDVELIGEGGFSKVYKAIWLDDSIQQKWGQTVVVLKKLNNSRNISSKELNELKIFYNNFNFKNFKNDGNSSQDHILCGHYNHINIYYGITKDPITQDFMIIMKYYELRDLTNYITRDFYNLYWYDKLCRLNEIISGIKKLHDLNIIHKNLHSGNILITKNFYSIDIAIIGDLGINKSCLNNDWEEIYGIIPYIAPEIFQGQIYTKESDIYSFGMIMWELLTGRKPFWDQNHDINLIVKICEGLRPPIINTNFFNNNNGYIKLMKECWNPNPNRRPKAADLEKRIFAIKSNEFKNCLNQNPTQILISPDIGPIISIHPGAIYKSRPLSSMLRSAMFYQKNDDKRKFENIFEDENNNVKKIKLFENENSGEYEWDNFSESNNNGYLTEEINFDI